jgi:hypothetical protein
MNDLSLELGEELADIGCALCAGGHKSAYGFIYKDVNAYGLYFATLNVGHGKSCVGLTLSLGKWWDEDAVDERSWVFISVWPEADEYHMGLRDPHLSRHFNFAALGKPLDWEAALLSPLRADFFEVTDYVIANDPAVASYLDTGVVDVLRWQQAQREQQSKALSIPNGTCPVFGN